MKLHVDEGRHGARDARRRQGQGRQGHPRLSRRPGRVTVEGVNIVKRHRRARTAGRAERHRRDAGADPCVERDAARSEERRRRRATRRQHRRRRNEGAHQREERRRDPARDAEPRNQIMATKEKEGKGRQGRQGRRQGRQGKGGRSERSAWSARRRRASGSARRACKGFYHEDGARPKLTQQFGFTNPHQVPPLEKIVINVGVGEAIKQPKALDSVVDELARSSRASSRCGRRRRSRSPTSAFARARRSARR